MNNLIRNELIKIFHKKALYIVFAITVGMMILSCVLTKIFKEGDFIDDSQYKAYLEEELETLDKNKPDEKNIYFSDLSELKTLELEEKYEHDSWQSYIINRDAQGIIYNMLYNEGTAEYNNAKKEYDKFIERLDNNNWRIFAEEELKEINEQIKLLEEADKNETTQTTENIENIDEESEIQNEDEEENGNLTTVYSIDELKDRKQALEWRLERDISYGTSNLNYILEQWVYSKGQVRQYENQAKTKPLKYSEKYEKQQAEETQKLTEYAITNKIEDNIELVTFNDRNNLTTNANSELIDSSYTYSLFIIIAIVIIAGTSISEEFNKGTIKLLLVRPYKRLKILIAKFIACLIVLVISYIMIGLATFVVNGLVYGFNEYTNTAMIYNFNTNSVQTIATFKYMILSWLSMLPQFMLLMTLAFTLSVLFINSPIAVALPLLGVMGSEIINSLALYYEKAKFLRFFVTPNWDLRMFLFGKLPGFEPISLPFSITVCVVYFIIMLVASMIVFKKREIKNI